MKHFEAVTLRYDEAGRLKVTGNPSRVKETQVYSPEYGAAVIRHYTRWKRTHTEVAEESSDSESVASNHSEWRDADLMPILNTLKSSPARRFL